MTKQEMTDKYFYDYLKWCSSAPEGKPYDLVFWLEHNQPIEDNFWEYMVEVRKDVFQA